MKLNKVISLICISLLTLALLIGCKNKGNGNNDENKNDGGIDTGSVVLIYTSNGDGTCYVSGTEICTASEVKIPSISPDGDTVVGIGEKAFENCSFITAVELPETVTSIGENAFAYCLMLESVTLPEAVRSIGKSAFMCCFSLESINIPEGVTVIEESTFVDCHSLVSITIPGSVRSIGDFAFMSCSSLVEVCNKSSLEIASKPNYNHYLGSYALHIYTDESETCLKRIGDCVFYDDGEQVLLVKYLGKDTDVVLPAYTDGRGYKIHRFAFRQNLFATSIIIPEGVTEISNSAFESCLSLTSVTIPSSVSVVDENAFFICYSLSEIVNKSSLSLDKLGKVITDESQSCISRIGDYVFYDDGNNVKLIKYIGKDNELTLPEYKGQSYSISEWAFSTVLSTWGVSVKSVVIPDCANSIEAYAFGTCIALENVTVGDGVVNIDKGAFAGCSSIKSISLGASVSKIDSELLTVSRELMTITVDENNESFKSVDGNLYSKDGKTLIRYASGKGESSFVIPDGVTKIDRNALLNATSLTTVVIPEGVTDIGERAFYGCGSITKVVIPKSLKNVGKDAFINLGLESPDGGVVIKCYYTGTEAEWKALRSNNSKYQTGLPYMANYNYVHEE